MNTEKYSRYLWLIGGTGESVEIAKHLGQLHLPCKITVTTPEAQFLYPHYPCLQVLVGQIPQERLAKFCQQQDIAVVLDASHPYAIEISQGVIEATRTLQIPYLRYERPLVKHQQQDNIIEVDSVQNLLNSHYLNNHRVLLTLGYKALPLFQFYHNQATLFARILPSFKALETAISAGFTSDRLIAIRPPISVDLEIALWQQWKISLVVAKASGKGGGEEIKRFVSQQLGIPLILISRPLVDYPQQTSNIAEALTFCRQYFS